MSIHQSLRQTQDLHGELAVLQQLQRPVRGHLARAIVVVAQHQLLGEAAQQTYLLLGQRRAHAGHRVVEPRLMQRHHVQVTLAQDHVGPLGLFGQVQAVEHPAFAVRHRFGGVHVFRLRLVDHAAAEAHHVAPHVDDRQHQPVAELIVQSAVFPVDHQPGGKQLLLGEALVRHSAEQRVPLVQRSAHAEAHRDTPPYLPLVQIRLHRRTLRKLQLVVVPPRRRAVQLQHPPPQPVGVAAGLVLRRQRDVGPLGQELHRLRERQALDLHNKIDDAAALFAAEAVVDLLVRRHGK